MEDSEEGEDEDIRMEDDDDEEETVNPVKKTSRTATVMDDSDDDISAQSKSNPSTSTQGPKVIRRSRAPAAKPLASRSLSQANSSSRNPRATFDEDDDDIIEIDEMPSKPPKRAIKTSATSSKKQPRQSTLSFSNSFSK